MEYAGNALDGQEIIQEVLTNEATIQVTKTCIKNQLAQETNSRKDLELITANNKRINIKEI